MFVVGWFFSNCLQKIKFFSGEQLRTILDQIPIFFEDLNDNALITELVQGINYYLTEDDNELGE